jgi:hypothetical protein
MPRIAFVLMSTSAWASRSSRRWWQDRTDPNGKVWGIPERESMASNAPAACVPVQRAPPTRQPMLTAGDLSRDGVGKTTPDRIRTCDPRFRKPVLYPLSYRGVVTVGSLSSPRRR